MFVCVFQFVSVSESLHQRYTIQITQDETITKAIKYLEIMSKLSWEERKCSELLMTLSLTKHKIQSSSQVWALMKMLVLIDSFPAAKKLWNSR